MKKVLLIIVFLLSIFTWKNVYAAPIYYQRSSNNLLLPSDVDITKVSIEEVLRIPAVDASAKIYDFADVLTEAEETNIYIQLNEYIKNTGFDAVIITTNDLAGFTMSDYAYDFYDYNDFKDVGVEFLIYINGDSKSIYMANNGARSSEVFKVYNDNRVNSIVKYVYENHIQQGDYAGACETFVKLCDGFYIKVFGTYHISTGGDSVEKEYPWLPVIIISTVLSFIIIVLVISKFQKPEKKVDMTLKKSVNTTNMVVKKEYDNPVSNRVVKPKEETEEGEEETSSEETNEENPSGEAPQEEEQTEVSENNSEESSEVSEEAPAQETTSEEVPQEEKTELVPENNSEEPAEESGEETPVVENPEVTSEENSEASEETPVEETTPPEEVVEAPQEVESTEEVVPEESTEPLEEEVVETPMETEEDKS